MTARVLAIDVTGPGGGAALLTEDVCTTALVPRAVRRGRTLVPLIARLLADAGLAAADLDVVACGVGPGSFTGIRIGVATAAALAYAAGRPVLDVGSLHGIAAGAPAGARTVLVALDARRDQVFAARFDDGRLVGEYRCAPPPEGTAGLPADAVVLGDARDRYPEAFDRFPGSADAPVLPDAIARLAAERFAGGERKEPFALRPLYLRRSDPEERRGAPRAGRV